MINVHIAYFLDSLYFGCAAENFDDIILPSMRQKYMHDLFDRCYKLPDGSPDLTTEVEFSVTGWFPRRCCFNHAQMDK